MSDELRAFMMQFLERAGASLLATALTVILASVAVVMVGYFLIRRMASRRGVNVTLQWRADGTLPDPVPGNEIELPAYRPQRAGNSQGFDLRRSLAAVSRTLTTLASLALLAGAGFAYWYATPANMLLLPAGILFILSFIVFASIGKYERNERSAEEWRGLWDEFRSKVHVTTHGGGSEVHHLNQAALATAQRMAQVGSPLDDICKAVEPGYSTWDILHQEAYRRVLQAALDHAKV